MSTFGYVVVSLCVFPSVLHHLPPRNSQANFFILNGPPPVKSSSEPAELDLPCVGVTRSSVGIRYPPRPVSRQLFPLSQSLASGKMLVGCSKVCSLSLQQLASPIACCSGEHILCSSHGPTTWRAMLSQSLHYPTDWMC